MFHAWEEKGWIVQILIWISYIYIYDLEIHQMQTSIFPKKISKNLCCVHWDLSFLQYFFHTYLLLCLYWKLTFVGIKNQRCYLQKTIYSLVQKDIWVLITKLTSYRSKKAVLGMYVDLKVNELLDYLLLYRICTFKTWIP